MYRAKLILYAFVIFTSFCNVLSQDYRDYESQEPRAAPVRLRPGNGPIDTRPTPVPILKQINRHNEDGSYTYGYEGADGSFKIETKLATGEVKGKYGYVDEAGKVRVVEYGANKYGFQPSGEGITVPPPTLVDESVKEGDLPDYEDDQQPQRPYIARVARPQKPNRPPPQVRPQYVDYDQPEPATAPQRPRYSSSAGPSSSGAPIPPRIQIPGAQPVGDVVYSQQPRPARPDPEYSLNLSPQEQNVRISRPVYAAAPQPSASARAQSFGPTIRPASEAVSYHSPRPVSYAPQSAPQGRSSSSLLDQLAKDYALPQGGAQALHDISFGYY